MTESPRRNRRFSRTRHDIKQALIVLLDEKRLDEVSMSELAKTAHVSRNTLYRHYGNVHLVYADILSDFTNMMSKALAKPTEATGKEASSHRPFCELVRSASSYGAISGEPRFIDTMFSDEALFETHPVYAKLLEAGYSPAVARGLILFQTQGCFKAANSKRSEEQEWVELRSAIDTFVKGGFAACLQQGPQD